MSKDAIKYMESQLPPELVGLAKLKARYQFPAKKPQIAENDFGWFGKPSEAALGQFLGEETKVILEIGSFLGKSTRWMLDKAPYATIICIDTWLGSAEHHIDETAKQDRELLDNMYEIFCKNNWHLKDRIIPIRNTSMVGIDIVAHYGIQPDVIFIDGAHDYISCLVDFMHCLLGFPDAQIVGDDWHHPPVQKAVQQVMVEQGIKCNQNGGCWWVDKS